MSAFTKKLIQKIGRIVANKVGLNLYSPNIEIDSNLEYYIVNFSTYKDIPLLKFLPINLDTKKVEPGCKSQYTLNMKTMKPTSNSPIQYDIPDKTKTKIITLIEPKLSEH